MLSCLILSAIVGFPFLGLAAGIKVKSRTETASDFISQQIRMSQSLSSDSKKDELQFSNWALGAEWNQNQSTSSDGAARLIQGRAFDAATGIEWKSFAVGLNLDSSQSSETKFSEKGGELSFSYQFYLEASKESSKKQVEQSLHRSSLNLGFHFGNHTIEQGVEFQVFNRTIQRTISLKQNSAGIDLSWEPTEWLSLDLTGTKFSYDRTKEEFVAASQSRLLNLKATDLLNTIYGLNDRTGSLTATWLEDDWDIALSYSRSTLFIDSSESLSYRLLGTYYFDSGFALGLGLKQTSTESGNSGSGLLDLSYLFR